jgi:hypothetical protein
MFPRQVWLAIVSFACGSGFLQLRNRYSVALREYRRLFPQGLRLAHKQSPCIMLLHRTRANRTHFGTSRHHS